MGKNELVEKQYKDSSNLNARIVLHERFSTNSVGFHEWVFEQLHLTSGLKVLECGCGPAALWYKNAAELPEGLSITLLDLSEGMLEDSRKNLHGIEHLFTFRVGDIQEIPFEAEYFDVVIANHMLYHVPDKGKAVNEVKRVLKPGGRFFASTFGKSHLKEIDELTRLYVELPSQRTSDSFTLENGFDVINDVFHNTELIRHEDSLVITEGEPLINYILSGSKARNALTPDKLDNLNSRVQQQIAKAGKIVVTKDAGIFISQKLECNEAL